MLINEKQKSHTLINQFIYTSSLFIYLSSFFSNRSVHTYKYIYIYISISIPNTYSVNSYIAMSSSPTLCQFDKDCNGNEVCFRNVSWRDDGCGCSTFYGFKRNPTTLQCSDLDQTAYFVIIYSSIIMVSLFRFFCFY